MAENVWGVEDEYGEDAGDVEGCEDVEREDDDYDDERGAQLG